jgi:2-methylcitrate dehydratase PrpD
MVAVMLLDKTVSFHAAHDKPRMQDAAALRERKKVELVKDEELAKLLPVRVAVVEVLFTDGKSLSEKVSAVRGTPRNPMTREEVVAKAKDLIEPVLGGFNASRIVEAVYAIDSLKDVGYLKQFLQRKQ